MTVKELIELLQELDHLNENVNLNISVRLPKVNDISNYKMESFPLTASDISRDKFGIAILAYVDSTNSSTGNRRSERMQVIVEKLS